MTINKQKLDFWIKTNQNVLMSGKHGTGKTARILQAFERNGLKYLYFSGPTMDPWVDLVGLPKEKKGKDGKAYIELVPPEELANDRVDAIFIDEFNRAPKKVRNALMELIQFKSINGRKFNNLKMVWTAVNPEDTNLDSTRYDVEPIDPAQLDRFNVHVNTPYEIDVEFFTEKYGEKTAAVAAGWWNELEQKQKDACSPRRLDDAISYFFLGGDLEDKLSATLPIGKLITELEEGATEKYLAKLFEEQDNAKTKKYFSNVNNVTNSIPYIKMNPQWMVYFVSFIPPENYAALVVAACENEEFVKWAFDSKKTNLKKLLKETVKVVDGRVKKNQEAALADPTL